MSAEPIPLRMNLSSPAAQLDSLCSRNLLPDTLVRRRPPLFCCRQFRAASASFVVVSLERAFLGMLVAAACGGCSSAAAAVAAAAAGCAYDSGHRDDGSTFGGGRGMFTAFFRESEGEREGGRHSTAAPTVSHTLRCPKNAHDQMHACTYSLLTGKCCGGLKWKQEYFGRVPIYRRRSHPQRRTGRGRPPRGLTVT